jgi:hypothetical protein
LLGFQLLNHSLGFRLSNLVPSLTAELQYLLWPLTGEPVPHSINKGDAATKDGAASKFDSLALFGIGPYKVLLDSATKHSRHISS